MITHWNITPTERGLNSKLRITMSHRLTCSPVHLDSVLQVGSQQPNSVKTLALDREYGVDIPSYENLPLNSTNGPNSLSKNNYSLEMVHRGGPYDLTVQPKSLGLPLHPNLKRSDGFSFLIIHRAGTTAYPMRIEDPFFSAHSNCSSDTKLRL